MPAPALVIPVQLTLAAFERGMASIGSKVDGLMNTVESKFKSVNFDAGSAIERAGREAEPAAEKAGTNLGTIISAGIIAAMAGVATNLISTINELAKFGDLAEDVRLPVNVLQALNVAAAEARLSTGDMTKAMEKFAEASKKGGSDAAKLDEALTNIGASFQRAFANAGTQGERLRVVADAFKATDNEAKRAQLSLQLFGTENTRFIGILANGREGIQDSINRMRDLGLTVDEDLVRSAQKARSEIALLSEVMTNKFAPAFASVYRAILPLLPPLEKLAFLVAQTIGALHQFDATKPTATLELELTQLGKRISDMEQLADDIRNKRVAPADSVRDWLRSMIFGTGFNEQNKPLELEQLDKDIEAARRRMRELDRLIAERQGKAAPTGGAEAPAFQRREPLGAGTSRDRLDAAFANLDKRTKGIEAETAAIDLNTAARSKAKVVAELTAVAMDLHGKVTDENKKKIDELATAYGIAVEKMEKARSPLASFARESANISKQLDQFATTSLNNFTDSLADVVTGAKSAEEAFSQLAKSIINDLARIAIRASITGPIAKALTGLGTPGAPLIFAPGMMAGGPVSGGAPYVVGERGPELFVPNSSGTIMPNSVVRGGGGAVQQTVIINDYSGQAQVKQTQSPQGGGVEVFIPALEQMLASGVARGRGALSKSVDARARGTNLYG